MVAVTYGVARAAAGALKPKKKAAGKGAFARFLNALMESRLRQAEREVAAYRRLHKLD